MNPTYDELWKYADGTLSLKRTKQITEHLRTNPEDTQRVEGMRAVLKKFKTRERFEQFSQQINKLLWSVTK